jgi:hypothetical protein
MVNASYRTEHDKCALCGAESDLYIMRLTARVDGEFFPKATLDPKPPETRTGVCGRCWWQVGVMLVGRAAGMPA